MDHKNLVFDTAQDRAEDVLVTGCHQSRALCMVLSGTGKIMQSGGLMVFDNTRHFLLQGLGDL